MKVAYDTVVAVATWGTGAWEECCAMCADIARDNPDVQSVRDITPREGICEWCEADAEFGGGDDDAE